MILKRTVTAVIFYLGFIQGINCASYSKVYVQSGANVKPYSYYNYGAPEFAYGTPLARYSSSPINSVVPLPQTASFVTPCVPAPCIPTQQIAPVSNAGLVAYKAPSVPVVVSKDEPSPYEYSYVVYDENTGDQKTLKELSDGSVVRGQYSLLQPDGYVREVQYTADDVTGFNAVVRRILPGGEIKKIEIKPIVDCSDKHASLKEDPQAKQPALRGHKEELARDEQGHGKELKTEAHEAALAHDDGHGVPKYQENSASPAKEKPKDAESVDEHAKVITAPAPDSHVEIITAEVKEEKAPKPAGRSQETDAQHAEHSKPTKPVESVVIKPVVLAQPQGVILDNPQPISYSTYSQLMKCIQAMQNSQQGPVSPLSYVLLPSNSLACLNY